MAISLVSFTHVDGTTATSTMSLTVAAGQSIVVYLHMTPPASQTVNSYNWNTSEALTQVGSGRLWYIKNPGTGTHNLVVVLSSDPSGRIGQSAWIVDGLDQTTSVRTGTSGNQTSQTDPGSSVGDLVVGGMTSDHGDTNTYAANASATEDVNTNTNPGTGASTSFWMIAEHQAGAAGTTPMSFQHIVDGGDSPQFRADFVALIPASGGGSATSGAGNNIRRRLAA